MKQIATIIMLGHRHHARRHVARRKRALTSHVCRHSHTGNEGESYDMRRSDGYECRHGAR